MLPNDDNDDLRNYQKKREMVKGIFCRQPHNVIDELEKLGFAYVVDDEEDESELAEERTAQAANNNEKSLVAYFNGSIVPDENLLSLWRVATNPSQGKPNYPLWRRYFRAGNEQLKQLLLFGLEQSHTDRELLSDLSFMHEFVPMLKTLITLYIRACDAENEAEPFKALARDFDNHFYISGYEALMALCEHYADHPLKAQWVKQIISEQDADATIEF